MSRPPQWIEIDETGPSPAEAAPVPDLTEPAPLVAVAQQAGRVSRLGRWFLAVSGALVAAGVSAGLWSFVQWGMAAHPLIGWGVTGLVGLALLLLLAVAGREALAFRRLARLDRLQQAAKDALEAGDRDSGHALARQVLGFYHTRPDLRWKLDRTHEQAFEQFDAEGVVAVLEAELMDPLDKAALAQVEAAARRVATLTALVPLALADVVVALTVNLRMVRAIAEVYGGRAGTLSSWRLVRAVVTHLVATGAIAVGDDLIGSVAGGALAGKISRRFGEGILNGTLTARVGITAITLCRPLPFTTRPRPRTAQVVKRALAGLFTKG